VNGWIIVGIVVAVVALGALAHRLGWIDLSNKNRSSGTHGGVMGIGDEIFNPSRYEAQIELDRQSTLPAPAPIPGDGDKGIADGEPGHYGGHVRIDLRDDRPKR
jgi:hypothetical protein